MKQGAGEPLKPGGLCEGISHDRSRLCGRKDHAMKHRRFTLDFKKSIVGNRSVKRQLLQNSAGAITSQFSSTYRRESMHRGKLNSEPSRETELVVRVRKLERLLDKGTIENEFSKNLRNSLK